MSDPQRLYDIGVIDIDEYCRRLVLFRSEPVRDPVPRFLKLDGAVGGESTLLQKISEYGLPEERIGAVNIKINPGRGKYSAVYRTGRGSRQIGYPGRFDSKTAAQVGVRYLVYAINNEIERRNEKALSAN